MYFHREQITINYLQESFHLIQRDYLDPDKTSSLVANGVPEKGCFTFIPRKHKIYFAAHYTWVPRNSRNNSIRQCQFMRKIIN
jgi:hypothetical protein